MKAYLQQLTSDFRDPVTAGAQILGLVMMLVGFFVFCFRDRRKIIGAKAVCDLGFAIHFFLLGQWTGGAVCTVNIFRGLLFSQRGRCRWADSPVLPAIFLLLTVASSLLAWTGPISLLPMVGSCLALIGYWCTDTGRLRKLNFAGIGLWLIYSVIILSVSSAINNLIYLISIIRTEIIVYKEKKE